MIIFDLLERDHNDVMDIIHEIKEMESHLSEDSAATLLELANELKMQITNHTDVEEEVVYKAVQKQEEENILILEAFQEHELVAQTLENALANLENGQVHPGFAQLCVVGDLLEHHIKEEEEEMFSLLKEMFSKEQLQEMADVYEKKMTQKINSIAA